MVRLCKTLIRRLLIILLLILAAYVLYISERTMGKGCSKEVSLEMLHKLCALYAASKVDGNFCHKICSDKSFQYEKCFNRVNGKKVMQVKVDDRRVIFKSRYAELAEYEPLFKGVLDDDKTGSTDHLMTLEAFVDVVQNHIQSSFGTEFTLSEEELIRHFLSEPTLASKDLTNIQMNSIWALLQQDEYLFFTYFNDASFFPQIYGACGHFYMEEYVPSGAVFQLSMSQSVLERYKSASWERRAKAARDLLDIVKATETEFKTILHLCDVKPENFGQVDSKVKAIDIDISFFDQRMGNFLEQPNCSKHEDCDFFDCHGVCNLATKKCTRKRRNNNFQSICKDVFQQKIGSQGLLRHPPPRIEEEISTLLRQCIYPDDVERVPKGSTTETFKMLYGLLSTSL